MAIYGSLGEVNVGALSASIADTAVDVFVYDTRKDSDGGQWRKRTQHTSWYNETLNTATRGSRRDFPAVAVIVAESNQVTIYDGDDPDLPMWMVFEVGRTPTVRVLNWYTSGTASISSVFQLNSKLCIGTPGGVTIFDFASDDTRLSYSTLNYEVVPKTISTRNNLSTVFSGGNGYNIIQSTINDVAMTVLPNAPIDDATGLPIPTIAVACGTAGSANGGVSIIKDDGTVVDIIATTGAGGYASYNVEFGSKNELIHTQAYNRAYPNINIFDNIPSSDVSANIAYTDARYYTYINSVPNIRGGVNGADTPYLHYVSNSSGGDIAFGFKNTNAKLSLLSDNKTAGTDATKSMVAYITSNYNTGWMHGDIKGAFLSDTDATNVTGVELLVDGSGNWAGDFDSSSDLTAWTTVDGGTAEVTGGLLKLTDTSNAFVYASAPFTTVIGKKYVVSFDIVDNGGTANYNYVRIGHTHNSTQNHDTNYGRSFGTKQVTFIATATTTYITLINGLTAGYYGYWDNVSVRLAEEDRSVNNKGLQVFGTVTKSAVATGAELVGYSGWSSSNKLIQPHDSYMDFGTGDITMMGWLYLTTYQYSGIAEYANPGLDANGSVLFFLNNDGQIRLLTRADGGNWNDFYSGAILPKDGWNYVCALRRSSGTKEMYFNGNLVAIGTDGGVNVTNFINDTQFSLGYRIDGSGGGQPLLGGSISLFRVSASTPSPEQVKKIYEDEKALFQPNSQCTLYGSSDAVTALAYDDSTNLLYAGTSSGRSDFQGLRRINNTTTAVTTAISASNGLVAEQ